MEDTLERLDLSGKKLKKLAKPTPSEAQVTTLILDDNELQRLDNIDSFTKVQKLSAVRNQLLRMYGVCRLHSLHTLNLAHNGILTIEGIKDLVNLKCLCLAGNSIKTIEHLNTNVNLEHLDLSDNSITHITDLSFLKSLKELLLHGNKIGHLRSCERYLPTSLVTLTLASNNFNDLNEISQLAHLTNLNSISIANNPCINMTGNVIGFDYRPFIVNWCMNVRIIDGYIVDAIERAEWLYSQGRGRHFRIGDHQDLAQYLATVCPLSGETLETEEDRKLRIILSKAQHHQQQLRDQEINPEATSPSPISRKKLQSAKNSPRLHSSRLSSRSKSPERMSSSCYSASTVINSPLMSQSLDPTILSQTINSKTYDNSTNDIHQNGIPERRLDEVNSPLQALSKLVPVPESLMSPDYRPSPLINRVNTPMSVTPPQSHRVNSAKNSPVVRSPKPSRIATPKSKLAETKKGNHSPNQQRKVLHNNYMEEKSTPPSARKKSLSSEDESEVCTLKLQTIHMKAEERRQQKDLELRSNNSTEEREQRDLEISNDKIEKAAICIQKIWRGYYTRNKNKRIQELFKDLQTQRAEEYIQKLATDMESTKIALESERRIQMLQMQAINALWKKVSSLQHEGNPTNSLNSSGGLENTNTEVVKDLTQTCSMLQNQILQLQGSMQDIIRFMSAFSQVPSINQQLKENAIATQTEISAVHTPQGEAAKTFPFQKFTRPSSLPLPVNQRNKQMNNQNIGVNQELKQFAGSLVDGVIKTVSETTECLGTSSEISQIESEKYEVVSETTNLEN